MVKSLRTRRAIVAATTAVGLASSVSAPVQSSEIQDAYYAHTRMCIGLFFTDHQAHSLQCTPNFADAAAVDSGSGGAGLKVVTPPPPPPVVVTPPSSYPTVPSSYPNLGSLGQ